MSWKPHLALALIVATTAACAGSKIGYDYDSGANFGSYRTYEWMEEKQEATGDRRVDSAHVDIRVRTAIGAQLRLKGYAQSVDRQPDFYVAYHLGVKDLSPDRTTQYFSEGMAGHPFSHSVDSRTMGKPHTEDPAIDSHMAGSLLVDIIDAGTMKLVWRGTAAGEVDPGLTSQQRDERMRAIVREMLSHFPPK